jgi:hypothetical protein
MNDYVQATVLIPKFLLRILQRKAASAGQDNPRSDINNLINEYLWRGILNDIKPVDLSNRRVREGEEIIPYEMPE